MNFHEEMIDIGENMRSVREKKGLSRKNVQDVTGISQQYIGEIERGEGNPTLEILYKLSDVYGITVAELIGDPAPFSNKIGSVVRKLKFTDKYGVYRILSELEKLSKEQVEVIFSVICHFKK